MDKGLGRFRGGWRRRSAGPPARRDRRTPTRWRIPARSHPRRVSQEGEAVRSRQQSGAGERPVSRPRGAYIGGFW